MSRFERVDVKELRIRRGKWATRASPARVTVDGEPDLAANRHYYAEYLSSDNWRERRTRLLKANCEKCGRGGDLILHHKTYEHVGRERPWELATLCPGCHAKLHAFVRQNPRWTLERASYRFLAG
jgi:hypothetical protein